MSTRGRSIILCALALLLLALSVTHAGNQYAEQQHPFTYFGIVKEREGECRGLTHYILPCKGCTVWLDWQIPPPTISYEPLRVDGLVYNDYASECQVMDVTDFWICEGSTLEREK